MSFKSSYNGFKRTKWDNKNNFQKAKLLQKHFEKLDFKVPKYLQGKNISESQINKAFNRINNAYEKKVLKEDTEKAFKGNINRLYKEYKNNIKSQEKEFLNMIKNNYGDEIYNAFKDKHKNIYSRYHIIEKPVFNIMSKSDIKLRSQYENKSISQVLSEMKGEKYFRTKKEQQETLVKVIKEIGNSLGVGYSQKELKDFYESIENAGYIETELLLDTLIKKMNDGYYAEYELAYNLSDKDELTKELQGHIVRATNKATKLNYNVR